MVNKRDRILKFIQYLQELGIEVNLNKNKARGNKGFFRTEGAGYRIDIAKGLSVDEQLSVLLHEFAHYIHFQYDKNLKNLDFIFKDFDEIVLEEMISVTVDSVPKADAIKLFEIKKEIKSEIKSLVQKIKVIHPDFKMTDKNKDIEQKIRSKGLAPMLQHDNVKILSLFSCKIYRITECEKYFTNEEKILSYYLQLKSKKRALNRINSRISKLNKYFNSSTELFARAFELFFTNRELMMKKAPNVLNAFDTIILKGENKYINKCVDIVIL